MIIKEKKIKRINIGFQLLIIFYLSCSSYSESFSKVKLGIDVLIESKYNLLKNKNIVLLTNNAGRTSQGQLTVEAFIQTDICKIVGILSPEHGFFTSIPAGKAVTDEKVFGLPLYSLYGKNNKPIFEHLKNCDVVVIDLQDIGIRSYTYISTVYNTMEMCADFNIPILILDRPNPLGGLIIDGNVLDDDIRSFVGIVPIPYIYGCTLGELSEMINNEGWLPNDKFGYPKKCNLKVVSMENWERWMVWEDTELTWFPTSPHIPTVNAVRGAAMLGVFGELGIISIGIGTTLPFQYLGAPNFHSAEIENIVGTKSFPGVNLNYTRFRPFYGMYSGKDCEGFLLTFPLSNLFMPYTSGLKLFAGLNKINPKLFNRNKIPLESQQMFTKVTGTKKIIDAFFENKEIEDILLISSKGVERFLKIREKYLLY